MTSKNSRLIKDLISLIVNFVLLGNTTKKAASNTIQLFFLENDDLCFYSDTEN